jgi:hypothetical protein
MGVWYQPAPCCGCRKESHCGGEKISAGLENVCALAAFSIAKAANATMPLMKRADVLCMTGVPLLSPGALTAAGATGFK